MDRKSVRHGEQSIRQVVVFWRKSERMRKAVGRGKEAKMEECNLPPRILELPPHFYILAEKLTKSEDT